MNWFINLFKYNNNKISINEKINIKNGNNQLINNNKNENIIIENNKNENNINENNINENNKIVIWDLLNVFPSNSKKDINGVMRISPNVLGLCYLKMKEKNVSNNWKIIYEGEGIYKFNRLPHWVLFWEKRISDILMEYLPFFSCWNDFLL